MYYTGNAILHCDKMNTIETFVNRYKDRSKNTMNNYRYILNKYFKTIKKDQDTYFNKPNEKQYMKDIETYWTTINNQAPKTRGVKLFCIKSFMMRNGVELKTKFYKELLESEKEKGALTEDYVPTNNDLKTILQHATVREKAWILLATTSGMRVGEILKLEDNMLHLDQDPPYIFLPGSITKNGYKRFTFCTQETKEALQGWQRVRTDYITKINGKNNLFYAKERLHDPKDKRIFPFSYNPIVSRWNDLIKIIEKDEKDARTNRRQLHIHCLRKYAITHMLLSMPEPMVNHIVGHITYLSTEYNKFTPEQIAPRYKNAMNDLSIFSTPDDEETHKRIQRLEKDNNELKEDMDKLMRKIMLMEK